MKKIYLIIPIAILILVALPYLLTRNGYVEISYIGSIPEHIYLDDDPDYENGIRELIINDENESYFKSNYSHFKLNLKYLDNVDLVVTLCNQNKWYENQLIVKRDNNNMKLIELILTNQDGKYTEIVNIEGLSVNSVIGICG